TRAQRGGSTKGAANPMSLAGGVGTPTRPARGQAGPSLLIPPFNKARSLPGAHAPILEGAQKFREKRPLAAQWLYVDVGRPDSPLEVARNLPADVLDVQVVSLSRNFGKEAALLAGLDYARFGAVLFMDGDGQHPPSLVDTLVGHWLDQGYDVVY